MKVYLDNCCFNRDNTMLKDEGMRILVEQLGIVEAERFISLLRREPFDYTKWRQGLYKNVSLDDFLQNAQEYRKTNGGQHE
ncbi:MAG: hypothetical protein FWB93_05700 [Oscillospiraceae bacterium]|nr:hypothetical protein [Oscillospiraceae bacterium]